MIVNGKSILGTSFAYDGCHKIYICETREEEEMMRGNAYTIYPIAELPEIWATSCPLRFIMNASLTVTYVDQCEDARFVIEDGFDYEDICNINVDVDSDGIYISDDGFNGKKYKPKTIDDLVDAFRDYVSKNPEISAYFKKEECL